MSQALNKRIRRARRARITYVTASPREDREWSDRYFVFEPNTRTIVKRDILRAPDLDGLRRQRAARIAARRGGR